MHPSVPASMQTLDTHSTRKRQEEKSAGVHASGPRLNNRLVARDLERVTFISKARKMLLRRRELIRTVAHLAGSPETAHTRSAAE
jgi:hypothetical protein